MENQQTAVAESSPAPQQTFDIPRDPAQRAEWLKTGELPGDKQKPTSEDSETSASADPEKGTAESAAASAPANKQGKKTDRADTRLNELLADLKRAGLTPAELKTFKREAAKAEPAKAEPASTTEKTAPASKEAAKPQELAAPVKPQQKDFDSWDKYEEARDKYFEDLTEYKSKLAVLEDRQLRAQEAQLDALRQKMSDAKARYGDETESTVFKATSAIHGDEAIPQAVRSVLDESPVLVDLMFTLGSDAQALQNFVALAKSNPGAALRKIVVLEQLVQAEVQKGSKATAAAETTDAGEAGEGRATERDASGKFVKSTPAKEKPTSAPPPPEELNTRGSAPNDPAVSAFLSGDIRGAMAAENRKDLARRKGA